MIFKQTAKEGVKLLFLAGHLDKTAVGVCGLDACGDDTTLTAQRVELGLLARCTHAVFALAEIGDLVHAHLNFVQACDVLLYVDALFILLHSKQELSET